MMSRDEIPFSIYSVGFVFQEGTLFKMYSRGFESLT